MVDWIIVIVTALGFIMGIAITETAHRIKKWNIYRVRRFTKKHQRAVQEALAYVNEYRTVVAYSIERSWDHYDGVWEGFTFIVYIKDDTSVYSAKKRVEFSVGLRKHLEDKLGFDYRHKLFYMINVEIYNDHNYKIYEKERNYDCYRVISDVKVVV